MSTLDIADRTKLIEALRDHGDWLADYPTEPWAQIRGIGNRIRDEYDRLDDAMLWRIMPVEPNALSAVMEMMLRRHGGGSG